MITLPTSRGFTLLEMVLVIVVIGILGSAITPVALASFRANAMISDVAGTVDKVRYANDRLAYELRELDSGSITTANDTLIVFRRTDFGAATATRTVTIDKTTPTANQCDGLVRLSYSTPVLAPAYVPTLTDQVCSLLFAYYDQTGAVTTDPLKMRYIEFTLTLKPTASAQPYSQRTRVALRNH